MNKTLVMEHAVRQQDRVRFDTLLCQLYSHFPLNNLAKLGVKILGDNLRAKN